MTSYQDRPLPDIRTPWLYVTLTGVTWLCTWGALMWPPSLRTSLLLLGLLVLITGLPHGATDPLLYRYLRGTSLRRREMARFIAVYLAIVGAFLLLWWAVPLVALGIFLVVSAYHFGQSNLSFLESQPGWLRRPGYLLWGGTILMTPLLFHAPEATTILGTMLTQPPAFLMTMASLRWELWLLMFSLNAWMFALFWRRGVSDLVGLLRELATLATLSALLIFTPLLLGFGLYFALWHATSSILEQIRQYRSFQRPFSLGTFYRHALPFTALAVVGMIGLCIPILQASSSDQIAGRFFLWISALTMPHHILIDLAYQHEQHTSAPPLPDHEPTCQPTLS